MSKSQRTRLLFSTVLGTLLVVAGCVTPLRPRPANLDLDIALGPEGAMILSQRVVHAPALPLTADDTLTWIAFDLSGREVTRGAVPDGRHVSYDDSLAPEGGGVSDVLADTAILHLRAPQIDGTLELRDPSGTLLATVTLFARRPAVADLLSSADVLGAAERVPGSASGALRVLFVPEGFREDELPAFHTLTEQVVAGLSHQADYGAYWDHFEFRRQDVRSRESGMDRGDALVDTAFDVRNNVGSVARCAFFGTGDGRAQAERLRDEAGAAVVVVLVNVNEWSGCASDGVTVNAAETPARLSMVVAHEMGHALFGLGDEYSSDTAARASSCGERPSWPNVAGSYDRLPWADLVTADAVPTPADAAHAGVVGAFEGAGYCATGRYRPSLTCLMRSAGAGASFCPVCRREMERRLGISHDTTPAMAMPGMPPASDGVHRTITVFNDTGAGLWARCASSTVGAGCSDWTYLDTGATASVSSFDGRYTIDNQNYLSGIAIHATFTATEDVVTVHPSASDPLGTAPTTTTGTPATGTSCRDTCLYAHDGACDDGSTGGYAYCDLGTDCADCTAATARPTDPGCDTCTYANDGVCDDGSAGGTVFCAAGTDCSDCAAVTTPAPLCDDTCTYPSDGECDDGGPGSVTSLCAFGSDCSDCGAR